MALIDVSNVSKWFKLGDETVKAIDQVSFSVNEGEFISIIGSSGSGKSTLMNILGLLDSPTRGVYSLSGRQVQTLNDSERAQLRNQNIGFVFQMFNLLPRASALRNVEMPLVYSASYDRSFSPEKSREMAMESLSLVGLEHRIHHKPNELSGGQRQRVAIARALVNRPKILLADEPTGNLDSKSGQEILMLFEELHKKGVTIILVTHDSAVASRADRVIVMRDGHIVEDRNAIQ